MIEPEHIARAVEGQALDSLESQLTELGFTKEAIEVLSTAGIAVFDSRKATGQIWGKKPRKMFWQGFMSGIIIGIRLAEHATDIPRCARCGTPAPPLPEDVKREAAEGALADAKARGLVSEDATIDELDIRLMPMCATCSAIMNAPNN